MLRVAGAKIGRPDQFSDFGGQARAGSSRRFAMGRYLCAPPPGQQGQERICVSAENWPALRKDEMRRAVRAGRECEQL